MIEAYEIGIRLALDDGISAGVQAIRRELVDLDRVIEASSVKLASLRDAAGLVAAPSVAEPPGRNDVPSAEPEEATQQPPSRAAVRNPESVEDEQPDPRGAPRTGRLAPEGAPLADPSARASAPSPSTAKRDAAEGPVADEAPYWTGSASSADASAPGPRASAPDQAAASTDAAPFPGPAVAPAVAAPVVIDDRRAASPPSVAIPFRKRNTSAAPESSSEDGGSPRTDAASRPSAPMSFRPADPVKPARAAPSATATISQSAAPTATSPTSPRPQRSGAAPNVRASTVVRETAGPEQTAPDRQPAAAKAGEDADQRTMEVFIYLEGAPLGRWMADQLDRAASRPSASVTGFDPRVGPAWPGASIG